MGQTERGVSPPTKWEVYEQILAIPYYIVFDRYTDELRVFWLEGDRYQQRELTEPRIWLPSLELGIGLWFGDYRGLERQWLRWYDAQGNWIPTPAEAAQERAESAEQQVENAQQRAESAEQRAENAERAQQEAIPRLLGMGLSAEQVAEALGLSVEQVNQWGQE